MGLGFRDIIWQGLLRTCAGKTFHQRESVYYRTIAPRVHDYMAMQGLVHPAHRPQNGTSPGRAK